MTPRPSSWIPAVILAGVAALPIAGCVQEADPPEPSIKLPHDPPNPDAPPLDAPSVEHFQSSGLSTCPDGRCRPPSDLIPLPELACEDDAYEPNDAPETAEMLGFVTLRADFFAEFDVPPLLTLCPDDDDWFMLPASRLDFERPYLFIRARVADTGLCGALCGEVELPAAPQNTLGVEVYHAATMELLAAVENPQGNVWLTDDDPRYRDDLLLRFYAPTGVGFDYRLRLDMRADLAEDECEC